MIASSTAASDLVLASGASRAVACVVGQFAGLMGKKDIPAPDVLGVKGIALVAHLAVDLFAPQSDMDIALTLNPLSRW